MNPRRPLISVLLVMVAVIAGVFLGRSQAQPQAAPVPPTPFLVRIGDDWFNPSNIVLARIVEEEHEGRKVKALGVSFGGIATVGPVRFGTDGQAEALAEWLDQHSSVLKPKPVKAK